MEGDGTIARASTRQVVVDELINHVNVHAMPSARESARWSNAPRNSRPPPRIPSPSPSAPTRGTASPPTWAPHLPPVPCRNGQNRSASGRCAIRSGSREFADIARQEYVAVGIRSALHPQIDLVTEPRWGRQFHSFGNDAEFVAEVAAAYIDGFQRRPELGPDSVATMTKHFPGGGPQRR